MPEQDRGAFARRGPASPGRCYRHLSVDSGTGMQEPSAIEPGTILPVPRRPNDHAAVAVHEHLRALILNGTLPPGAVLNQVELAPQLGVSRTPIREAIRMLQEE